MPPATAPARYAALPWEAIAATDRLPLEVHPVPVSGARPAAFAAESGARGVVREHSPFLVVIGLHVLCGALLGYRPRLDTMLRVWFLSWYPLAFCAIGLLASYGVFHRRSLRAAPALTRGEVWTAFRTRFLTGRRVAGFAVVFTAFPVVMSQYISLKSGMAEYAPFAWDARFAAWDRALHLGRDPWRILHPLLANPHVTKAIDVLYYVWFPMKAAYIVTLAWSGSRVLRMQGLVAYALVLALLGNAAAALLSSAGPVYYARVTGLADPYQPLFSYLHSVVFHHNLFSLDAQTGLWAVYTGKAEFPFSGISAAPSVHVALSVLFALVGWRMNRWLGGALALYAVAILMGSVHLGWHYALDGYISAVATLLIWKAAGRWAEWHFERTRLPRRLEAGVPGA